MGMLVAVLSSLEAERRVGSRGMGGRSDGLALDWMWAECEDGSRVSGLSPSVRVTPCTKLGKGHGSRQWVATSP